MEHEPSRRHRRRDDRREAGKSLADRKVISGHVLSIGDVVERVRRTLHISAGIPEIQVEIIGAWGIGLYRNDMAADMRALVKSTVRLPFDEDRIVEIIRECEPTAGDDHQNEDHTTFCSLKQR